MNKIVKGILTICLMAVIGLVVFVYADANMEHYTAHMESDIASETLLAEVLYQNGHIQPDTWQMSTGRRIIAPPMLASFLYPMVDFDLNVAMGLACSLMMIMLIGAMLFFNRQIELSLLQSLVAVLLTLVLCSVENETQRHLFLYAAYYAGHFICMFLVLGFYAGALKKEKLPIIGVIVTIPLALVNGMQGMHASMFFYMPLLGTEILRRIILFIKKKKSSYAVTVWVAFICIESLVAVKLFGTHMVSDVSRNIRHAPEKFFDIVLPFFGEVLGYSRMPIVVAVFIIIGVIGFAIAFLAFKDKPELWSALPILFGVIVPVLSTTFTTAESAPRYYIMQVFVVAVGTALFIKLVKPDITTWLAVLAVFYGIISAAAFYEGLIKNDTMGESDLAKVTEFMEDNGYNYGYAIFPYANMATVVCNNSVKVRSVNSYHEMEGSKWLSDSTWYPPVKDASGKTCYVVGENYIGEFNEFIDRVHPVIVEEKEIGSFVVYVTDRDYTVWVD